MALKLQLAVPAAMAPAASETLEGVNDGVPLQPAPDMALTPVTVSPAGKLSVKASPFCAGLVVPFVMVKFRVLLLPVATVARLYPLARVGRGVLV